MILSENINCGQKTYSFNFPEPILDLTINKELTPFLLKMGKKGILQFFGKVLGNYTFVDKDLPKKIKNLLSTKAITDERKKYIDALKEFGFTGSDDLWDLYPLEELKKEYKLIVKKK